MKSAKGDAILDPSFGSLVLLQVRLDSIKAVLELAANEFDECKVAPATRLRYERAMSGLHSITVLVDDLSRCLSEFDHNYTNYVDGVEGRRYVQS